MEQNTIKIENIKVGDKVIRSDGLAGKVTQTGLPVEYGGLWFEGCYIEFENGAFSLIVKDSKGICGRRHFVIKKDIALSSLSESDIYLIGTTIFGNKVPVREIEQRIEANKAQIEQIKVDNAQLAKQAWRLRSVMTGEYPLPADKRDDEAQRIKKQIAFIKSQMAEITQTRIKLDSPTLAEQAYKAYAEELNRLQDGE